MKSGSFKNTAPWIFAVLIITASGIFAQNSLVLNINQARDTIRKTVYGGLMEDWGRDIYGGLYVGTSSSIPNTSGMRNDVIEGFKEIGIGVLQFPGGCNAEVYKWREGIGAKSSRPGGEVVNGMGTDEYFQLCSLVNCAPFVQANCLNSTPAEMAAWLDYIHSKYPNRLRYLGMGNEPWGGCYPGITVNQYLNSWYEPFNAAIPAVFNGKIVRVGAAGAAGNTIWDDEIMRRETGKMEGLSWHWYSTLSWTEGQKGNSYGFPESEYYSILQQAYNMENSARTTMNIMDTRDPNYTVGFQPDEWGAWYNEIPNMGRSFQQSSVRDAQITAQHLNFFNNNCRRIWMAQAAQPVNAIHSFFLTRNPPTTELIKTPTFYVYKLYLPHHNALMVPATLSCGKVNNLNVLTASASINSSDILHISVNNIHATASQPLTITLNDSKCTSVSGQIVNGPLFNSINDFGVAEQVNIQTFPPSNYSLNGNRNEVTVTLPAHSVVMLELPIPNMGTVDEGSKAWRQFAVTSLPGNRIVVRHGFVRATPITLSLFTLDGILIAPTFSTVIGSDRKSLVWSPKTRDLGSATYIVKVSANKVTKSQRVVLRKER